MHEGIDPGNAVQGGLVLDIESLAYGGRGVARGPDGKVFFVPLVIPGERVEVSVERVHASYCETRLDKVLEPSGNRVQPFCQDFGTCGGCDWQHIRYPHQVELKHAILKGFVERVAPGAFVMCDDVPSPRDIGYRCRATLRFVQGGGVFGFYARGSHDVVPFRGCAVLTPLLQQTLRRLAEAVREGFPAGAVEINVIAPSDDALVSVTLRGRCAGKSIERLGRVRESLGIAGLAFKFASDRRSEVLGSTHVTYTVRIGGSAFRLTCGTGAFLQANAPVNEAMVAHVTESLGDSRRVLDLYAGSGNFSIPAASRSTSVFAVESDRSLVRLGMKAASLNGCTNVAFVRGDARRVVKDYALEGRKFDAVVLDPPRQGAREVAASLDALGPGRVVYVSCNPSTMARDVSILCRSGFGVVSVRLFDMFPHTHHIESVVVLER